MANIFQSTTQYVKDVSPYYTVPAFMSAFVGASGYALGFFMAPVAVASVGVGIAALGAVYMVDTLNSKYNKLEEKIFSIADDAKETVKAATDFIKNSEKSLEEINATLKQVQTVIKQVEDTKQVEKLAEIEQSLKALIDSIDPEKVQNIMSDVESTTARVNDHIMEDVTAAVNRFSQATMIFGGPHHQQQQAQVPAPAPQQAPAPRGRQSQSGRGRSAKR